MTANEWRLSYEIRECRCSRTPISCAPAAAVQHPNLNTRRQTPEFIVQLASGQPDPQHTAPIRIELAQPNHWERSGPLPRDPASDLHDSLQSLCFLRATAARLFSRTELSLPVNIPFTRASSPPPQAVNRHTGNLHHRVNGPGCAELLAPISCSGGPIRQRLTQL